MAANAANVPKGDLEAASAALLRCLSSKVWITDHQPVIVIQNRSSSLTPRSLSQSQSEATSLLSDPAQLGAVYGTEVQQGQSGASMWMWPPFKYVVSL